jgi:hypothetical protein
MYIKKTKQTTSVTGSKLSREQVYQGTSLAESKCNGEQVKQETSVPENKHSREQVYQGTSLAENKCNRDQA